MGSDYETETNTLSKKESTAYEMPNTKNSYNTDIFQDPDKSKSIQQH